MRLHHIVAGREAGGGVGLGGAPAENLSRARISVLAAACGLAVANANYAQPLLVEIGRSLDLSDAAVSLVPALTQLGVSAGILFLLPLGDTVPTRLLLTVAIIAQALALFAMSVAPDGTVLLALSLLIGVFGITPYVLPPYATLRTAPAQRGLVTALLAQGVIVGMLLARSISGVVGLHFGWRSVYAMAGAAMVLLLVPLRRAVRPAPPAARASYRVLLRSLAGVFRAVPEIRWSAACQGLATGAFTVLWTGISFQMQSATFGWRSDGVGALALVGAASALCAPFVGGFADRKGPRRALLTALGVVVLSWVVLAGFGHRIIGVIVGMILLDMGAAAADISNRTVIFGLQPDIRTRLTTVYMVGKFAGAGVMAWLTGLAWAAGGWPAVCGLGATSAGLALLAAWIGVGRRAAVPRDTAPVCAGTA